MEGWVACEMASYQVSPGADQGLWCWKCLFLVRWGIGALRAVVATDVLLDVK